MSDDRKLFAAQGGRCILCGESMRYYAPFGASRVSGDNSHNLKLAHRVCPNHRSSTGRRVRKDLRMMLLVVGDDETGPLPFGYSWLRAGGYFEADSDNEGDHPMGDSP